MYEIAYCKEYVAHNAAFDLPGQLLWLTEYTCILAKCFSLLQTSAVSKHIAQPVVYSPLREAENLYTQSVCMVSISAYSQHI